MSHTKIKVWVDIEADIQKVWKCYTQPQHIVGWNFASDTWHCPWAKNDLRVGGKYIARMEAKDASEGFDLEAVYEHIDHERGFSYRMADGRVATCSLESLSEQTTRISIVFDAEHQNSPDLQKQGWLAILNQFRLYTQQVRNV